MPEPGLRLMTIFRAVSSNQVRPLADESIRRPAPCRTDGPLSSGTLAAILEIRHRAIIQVAAVR
jgi:hypothetical protein